MATHEDLFSRLYASGSAAAQMSVAVYPCLQNFTTIPVLAILMRYNLQSSGFNKTTATSVAIALPWVLCIPFYCGNGFKSIAKFGGLATSSVINFAVPLVVYWLWTRRGSRLCCSLSGVLAV